MLGMSPAVVVDAGGGVARVSTCRGPLLRFLLHQVSSCIRNDVLRLDGRSSVSHHKAGSSCRRSMSCG